MNTHTYQNQQKSRTIQLERKFISTNKLFMFYYGSSHNLIRIGEQFENVFVLQTL